MINRNKTIQKNIYKRRGGGLTNIFSNNTGNDFGDRQKRAKVRRRLERTLKDTKPYGSRSSKLDNLEKELNNIKNMNASEFLSQSLIDDTTSTEEERNEFAEKERERRLDDIMNDIGQEVRQLKKKKKKRKLTKKKEKRIKKKIKKNSVLSYLDNKIKDIDYDVDNINIKTQTTTKDITFIKSKIEEITNILDNMNKIKEINDQLPEGAELQRQSALAPGTSPGDEAADPSVSDIANILGEREKAIDYPPGTELPEGAELQRQSALAPGTSPGDEAADPSVSDIANILGKREKAIDYPPGTELPEGAELQRQAALAPEKHQ